MEAAHILQEVVRCADLGYLIVTWKSGLEEKESEEVELVPWADATPLYHVIENLVTVEALLLVIDLVEGDVGGHRVGPIAQLKRHCLTP